MSNEVSLKQDILNALLEMQGLEALSEMRVDLEEARKALESSQVDSVHEVDEILPPTVGRVLRLHMSGYFSGTVSDALLEETDSSKPDDTNGLDAQSFPTELPKLDDMLSEIKEHTSESATDMSGERVPVGGGEALSQAANVRSTQEGSTNESVTFLFLADPQISRAQQPHNANNPRVQTASKMNEQLNSIWAHVWPKGMGLSEELEGTPIVIPRATFFGGDLCQTGGDYNFIDQAMGVPAFYIGGFELDMVRDLFDYARGFSSNKEITKLMAGPMYYGLGNHDVQTEHHPPVGWCKGCLRWSTPSDYWRWQMWNFVCQKHSGVFTNCVLPTATDPTDPPTGMDVERATSNDVMYWTERSLNYYVDLGPVDVYQLHVFGGDQQYGRACGLEWLRANLAANEALQPGRPVIIVQHYDFSDFSIPSWWTEAQRDALLSILEPYNVVAFLMGHNHAPLRTIPLRQPYPNSSKVAEEFRPGSAGVRGNFALVRVTNDSLNIVQGSTKLQDPDENDEGEQNGTEQNGIRWISGYHKTW